MTMWNINTIRIRGLFMSLWQMLIGEQPGIIDSIRNYQNKGQFGEYLIEYALNHDNLPGYLKTKTNVYVPYKDSTSEIDVIMVHEKGIFVFESKNYSGWIFGSADQQKWTQSLKNGEKHQFYNPILQNRSHIKALAAYLGLHIYDFTSYIIFSERCRLKQAPPDTVDYIILNQDDVLRSLRPIIQNREIHYTPKEVDALVER